MNAESLLQIEDLIVDYGRRRSRHKQRALDGVSLSIAPGETLGLVGESGSGKSTIARAVLGLAPISHGTVTFDGQDISHASFQERRVLARDLQAVFQDPTSSINPARTVGSALAEPLIAQGTHDRAAVRHRIREMLERVGLSPDAEKRYPGQFSGGQRQRIGIARALMLSPKLVICDEVVSALDLSVQAQVLNLLQDLQGQQHLSYLFISHDLEVVRHVCDRIAVLYQGRIVETGPMATVSAHRAHPYTDALHAAAPVPNPREQAARRQLVNRAVPVGTPAGSDLAPPISGEQCAFTARCPYAVQRCHSETPILRPVDGDVSVACHRFPAWLDDRPQPKSPTLTRVDAGHRTMSAPADRHAEDRRPAEPHPPDDVTREPAPSIEVRDD